MKRRLFSLLLVLACCSCSMAPERPFTKEQLYGTGIYTYYTLNDSPESVLAEINKKGEAILDAKYRGRPVWVKILGKIEGLSVTIIEK